MTRKGKHGVDAELLLALASGATVESAARNFGVSERTVYRRLKNPEFRERIKAERTGMFQRLSGIFAASSIQSVKTLLSLQDDAIPPTVRLGAARTIIDKALHLRESVDFDERLSAVEQRGRDTERPPAAAGAQARKVPA
jgi:hypothetical protein